MPLDLARFNRLKESADDAKRETAQAEGALRQLMRQLKDEFDCDSLEEAEEKAAKAERDAAKAEKKYETALTEFEKKWGGKLEGK